MLKYIKMLTINNEKNPLVTVVVPVFNGENYINNALSSLLNQTYTNLEILVIDDGSSDTNYLKNLIENISDSRIRLIQKLNGGVASALNVSLKVANGKYWTWLSHDDEYLPNKILNQVNHLEASPWNSKKISFTNYELINEVGDLLERVNLLPELERVKTKLGPVERRLLSGCTLMLHTSFLRDLGNFNETLLFTQDYDKWLSAVTSGGIFEFLDDSSVKVRVHKEQGSADPRAYGEISEFWVKVAELWLDEVSQVNDDQLVLEWLQEYLNFASAISEDQMFKILNDWRSNFLNKFSVGIIIPFHNRFGQLPRAVESAQNQTHTNIKIVLIDDTQLIDKSLLNKILTKFENVYCLINSSKVHGPSVARNIGLKYLLQAEVDFVAFLDSDDYFLPRKIELQLEKMVRENSEFSHTDYLLENEVTHQTKYIDTSQHRGDDQLQFILKHGCLIAMPTTMFDIKIFKKYNIEFDSTKKVAEDLFFYLDFIQRSTTNITHLPSALTFVREHPNMHANNPDSLRLVEDYLRPLRENIFTLVDSIDSNEKRVPGKVISYILIRKIRTFCKLLLKNLKNQGRN